MKEWYTNAELAGEKLPGFPRTTRGVGKWFTDREYDQKFPGKVRPRQGRGGGTERHYTLLPKGAQTVLAVRHLKETDDPVEDDVFNGTGPEIPEPVGSEKDELRRDAKLLILSFWDIFRSKQALGEEFARHQFVMMYRNGRIEGIPDWVRNAVSRKLSPNTLRSWEKKRANHEFADLAGNYGNRKGTGVLNRANDGRVAEFIAAKIVNQPHLNADHVRDLVKAEFGGSLDVNGEARTLPPVRTFQRFISSWKKEHEEGLLKMTDPDAWKSKRRFSGTNMNHWVSRPNQLWEIDASPADCLLVDGRYSIYALVDIQPRRMMVTVTKTPKTQAVLLLIRKAILAWGIPEIIRTDNGADFISHEFKRALSALAIHHDITDPFSPEQKGTVERHIGTLQRGLMVLLPGFIGHSVADRKQIEARKSFAARLGESDSDAFCVELTHEELQTTIDRWLKAKYDHKPHSGLGGKTPFEVISSWTGPIRRIDNERALDLLLAPIVGKDGFRTVTKFGIKHDKAYFISPALVPGERVFCRSDSDDMGRIYVFDETGREFLCVAECPERVGVNPGEAVRAVREAQKQRLRDELEPLQREIRAMKPRDMIEAVLDVNERETANLTQFPSQSEAHATPELEAANEAVSIVAGPRVPEEREFTEDEARMHEEIVADLHAERRRRAAPGDDPELSRFKYAIDLQETMKAGEHIPSDEMRWLIDYQTTPEYRGLLSMYEDFGDRLFV